MILAFDTFYIDGTAKTVCISFKNWTDNEILNIYSETIPCNENYISGEFYKKELPCILSLYEKIDNKSDIEAIIVDGYVYVNNDGKYGLGGHLHYRLNGKIPIIGIAKTNFAILSDVVRKEVFRGISKNPLYVSSIGADLNLTCENIKSMFGEYRMPTLLKKLDNLTKEK